MIGTLSDFGWGVLTGAFPYLMFLLCSLRFAEPARREKADVSFWRVLRRVFMEDVGIMAVLLLTLTTLGDLRPWTSAAGWLGAGVSGFAELAFLILVVAKKETAAMRAYYQSISLMQALAILIMTGLGCVFIGFEHPWVSALVSTFAVFAAPSAVFVALSAFIYVKPPPSGLEQPV